MKSIVFLGAFALLIILALGDVPQESSQDVAEASEFGLLDREAREAGRKKRKGNKRNKKGKRNGKKLRGRKRKNKGKGKGKAKGNGKQGTGRKGNSKGNGKGKGSNKKPRNNQRQTSDTVPAADVAAVFAEYRKGTNRLRQVKRIVKWISQLEKKKAKAATEFGEAAKALDEATNTGSDCDGALANNTVKADVLELNNCSASAQALCTPPANVSDSVAKNCVDILELSVNSTKAWLSDPKTSTFPPVYPDPTCVEFAKTNETVVKTAREDCIGTNKVGSFGACSSVLKKSAGLIKSCGKIEPNGPVPSVVTSASSGRHRIFKFQQQFL